MTTAAQRRRRRKKKPSLVPTTGVLRGRHLRDQGHSGESTSKGDRVDRKKKKPSSGKGGHGGGGSGNGSGSRTPVPKAPTKTNAYQPSAALAQTTMADLTRLHDSMSQDDFAATMHTYGGTGSPDGNGYLGQQAVDGAGQMSWPGSTGPSTAPTSTPTTTPPGANPGVVSGALTDVQMGQLTAYLQGAGPRPGWLSSLGSTRQAKIDQDAQQIQSLPPGQRPAAAAGAAGTFITKINAAHADTAPATTGGGTGTGSGGGGTTSTADKNADMLLQSMLDSWGLGSLGSVVLDYLKQGYDATSIQYLLTQTPEYKRRFSGNDARIKAGLGALSPAEYLATERAYQDVLRSAGLPAGFYDSPDDFTSWIAGDTSPTEVAHRVDDAVKFAQSTDPTYRTALQAYFGIDTAHIAAYFLDPQRALPLLTKQANASSIGAAALNQGLMITNLTDAFTYTDQGVTEQSARDAYGQIADFLPTEKVLGQRFGSDYNQHDAEQELLGGMASSARKRRSLNQSEEALFAGSGGQSQYSLGGTDSSSY